MDRISHKYFYMRCIKCKELFCGDFNDLMNGTCVFCEAIYSLVLVLQPELKLAKGHTKSAIMKL